MTTRTPALPARLGPILCLDDFEIAARRHLPAPIFAYVCGGVERNHTVRANARAFEQYEFVTRVLVDTSKRSTETPLFGRTGRHRSASPRWASAPCPPTVATWCWRQPRPRSVYR